MVLKFIVDFINTLSNSIPEDQKILVSLVIYTFLILVYSVFIWKFYTFLSKRDILELNLRDYNNVQHPFLAKFLTTLLFTLEYLVILPFLVLFWFAVFSILLLLLSNSQNVQHLLLISTAIITSIRVVAYFNGKLAEDLAKILPFTVLVTFIIGFDVISIPEIIGRFNAIPQLLKIIFLYLFFIIVVEFIMRLLYSFYLLIHSNDSEEKTS